MCDVMTEPPLPGTDLYTYWREEPYPTVGEERDMPLGEWMLRVRITKVKESVLDVNYRHVTMTVIG